jgi:hypothetical protein
LRSARYHQGWRTLINLIFELSSDSHAALWHRFAIEYEEVNSLLSRREIFDGSPRRKLQNFMLRKISRNPLTERLDYCHTS